MPLTGLLLAALGAANPSARAAPVVVERVVAVIRPPASTDARVVTLTRVEEELRIALVSSGATLAATQALDAPALRAGLEWLIDQILLDEEAARLQVFEIEQPEVRAELSRFQARFERAEDYRAFLARYDISEDELASVLRRTLRVRRYIESRLARTRLSPPPARPDASASGGQPLDKRFREEVKVLVRDLRARADVRRIYDFGASGAGAEPTKPDREG
jgi:hypothetical protein